MTGLRADIINNCLKQNRGKNMTKLYAMYMRLTSNTITKVESKQNDGKYIAYKYQGSTCREVELRTNKIARGKKDQYTLIQ